MKGRITLAALALAALIAAGCGSSNSSSSSNNSTASSGSSKSCTATVGFEGPITGPAASLGGEQLAFAKLAVHVQAALPEYLPDGFHERGRGEKSLGFHPVLALLAKLVQARDHLQVCTRLLQPPPQVPRPPLAEAIVGLVEDGPSLGPFGLALEPGDLGERSRHPLLSLGLLAVQPPGSEPAQEHGHQSCRSRRPDRRPVPPCPPG